jgi:hypothetical protein
VTQVVDPHVHEPGWEMQVVFLGRGKALLIGGLAAKLVPKSMDEVCGRRACARARSHAVARSRHRCQGGCGSVLRAPGVLPQMTQGLSGQRSSLENTSSAGAPRWT